MSISESDYKKMKSKMGKLEKEAETIGNRIEPYWDSKTKKLKADAPENIKKDYQRFLEIVKELSADY